MQQIAEWQTNIGSISTCTMKQSGEHHYLVKGTTNIYYNICVVML